MYGVNVFVNNEQFIQYLADENSRIEIKEHKGLLEIHKIIDRVLNGKGEVVVKEDQLVAMYNRNGWMSWEALKLGDESIIP